MKALVIALALLACLLLLPASGILLLSGKTAAAERQLIRPVTGPVPGLFPVLTSSRQTNGLEQFTVVPYCLLRQFTSSAHSVSFMLGAGRTKEIVSKLRAQGIHAELQHENARGMEQEIRLHVWMPSDAVMIGWYKACSNCIAPRQYAFYFGPALTTSLLSQLQWHIGLVWACASAAVLLVAWAWLRARRHGRARLQIILALLPLSAGGLLALHARMTVQSTDIAWFSHTNRSVEARELSEQVCTALEIFFRAGGFYPYSLSAIWPEPAGAFEYHTDGTSYTLTYTNTSPGFQITRHELAMPSFRLCAGALQ